MIQNKTFLISYKLFFALLGFSSLVTEIAIAIERGWFDASRFFSYFTVETNILVVIALLLSAVAVAMGKNAKLDVLRGMTTVYILVVGIGFSLLLASGALDGTILTAVPWNNAVLHYIIPVAVLIDFLIDRPKRSLSFKKSLVWLLFPIIYVTYALVRGVLTGWYPYPFLDLAANGGLAVGGTVVGLFALGFVLIWGVCRLTGAKKPKKSSAK